MNMTTWLIIGGAAAVGGYVLYSKGTLHKIIPMVPSPDPANLPASAVGPNVPDRIASKRTVGQVIAETSFNMLPASAQQKAIAAGTTVKRSQAAIDAALRGDVAGALSGAASAYTSGASFFAPTPGGVPSSQRTAAQQVAATANERAANTGASRF